MSADGPLQPPAAERLAASRERLRQSLRHSLRAASAEGLAASPSAPGSAAAWLTELMSIPGAGVIVDAARGWWAQHPLRLAALVATDAAKTLVRPLAQRNPIGLVVGAFLLGGVIVWIRPWRGILKPALFAGLLPQLISKAMAQVPLESWMSVLMTSLAQQPVQSPNPEPMPGEEAPAAPVSTTH